MKKYKLALLLVLVFGFIGFGFSAKSVNADNASGCLTGDLFSRTTGQACSNYVSTSCLPGDLYSSLTGQPCIKTTGTPAVSSILPTSGPVGSSITLIGSGFTSNNSIKFGGGYINGVNSSSNGTSLTFTLPVGLGACLPNFSGIIYACPAMGVMITPGDYKVSVLNAGGMSNTVPFTVTSSNSTSPIISGVAGPQSLSVKQQGIWTVTASDPKSENLSYTVNWGDNIIAYPMNSAYSIAPQQSATFTHTYSSARIYTPTFTVTNADGQSAQTSLTVSVGGGTIPSPISICNGSASNSMFGMPCVRPGSDDYYLTPTTTPSSTTPPGLPISSPGCMISATLMIGSRGVDVDCLQKYLGLFVDGNFGAKTRAAVLDFQNKFGLTADGVFGPKSIDALQSEGVNSTQ